MGGSQTYKASQRISLPRKEMILSALVLTHRVRLASEFRVLQQQWEAQAGPVVEVLRAFTGRGAERRFSQGLGAPTG